MDITEKQYNKLNELFNALWQTLNWDSVHFNELTKYVSVYDETVSINLNKQGPGKQIHVRDKFSIMFAQDSYDNYTLNMYGNNLTAQEIMTYLIDIMEKVKQEKEKQELKDKINLQREKDFVSLLGE